MIVPCYNEKECISLLCTEVQRVFAGIEDYDWSILFVDDGSRDGTMSEIRKAVEEFGEHRIKYISFSRNFGKEAAMLAGLEYGDADYYAIMDADLQHPPALLPEMLKAFEEGYDVCGARRVSRKGEPPIRSFFSRAFYQVINRITGMELTPGGSDFRVMKREVGEAIASMHESQRFIKGIYSYVGFRTKWIPYDNVERSAGKTKWSFGGLAAYAVNGFFSFAVTPLRIAVWMGFLIDLITLVFGIRFFWHVLTSNDERTGYGSTVLLIAFFGGTIILLLGIIGEYLARIYMEVKRRPAYVVREFGIEEDKSEN